jgi:hypothetical protein
VITFDEGFGPETRFGCDYIAGDKLAVRRIGLEKDRRAVVGIMNTESGQHATILLRPANARRLAAQILNLADECDGTVPLCFVPPGPSA